MWGSTEETEPFLGDFFEDDEVNEVPRRVASDAWGRGLRGVSLAVAVHFREAEGVLRRGGSLLPNGDGLSPVSGQLQLHKAVREKRLHCLQHLMDLVHDVNAVDSSGKTALFLAVELGWVDGVRSLLNARADVRTRYRCNNKTVLQMAVNANKNCVTQLIVDAARTYEEHDYEQIVNVLNDDGLSPLFVAVNKGNVEIVEILLSGGANVTLLDVKGRNVVHVVDKNSERMLAAIGKRHPTAMKLLICQRSEDRPKPTPLHSAIRRGDVATVQYLATKFPFCLNDKAYVHGCNDSIVEGNVLHLVSESERSGVLAYFVSLLNKNAESFRCAVDGQAGNLTPLHYALLRRQVDFAVALIRAGADLSAVFDGENQCRSAVDVFVHQVPASVEKLTKIFDESIEKLRGKSTVSVDYEVLWSGCGREGSFKVLSALQATGDKLGQEVLFEHPLVESYLHLHWKRIQGPYLILAFLNAFFSLSLSLFILFELLNLEIFREITTWTTLVSGILLSVHEFECLGKKQPWKYRADFLMKCACFCLTGYVMFFEIVKHFLELETDLFYELSAFAVLFSWFELLLLVSRIPNTGHYMLLFLEVARKYLKLLLSFFFLLFGFIVAFMAISRLSSPFDEFFPSTMKVLVMFSGEYDYGAINKALMKANLPRPSQVTAMVVFTMFVIFVGLVLNNLFVAIAVNDVSKVQIIGKRTEFLAVYTRFLQSKRCCVYPRGIMNLLFRLVCAVVRPCRPNAVSRWDTFREIDRRFEIGVLLNDQKRKFPRELNTAIIARGYKNRELMRKRYQEEEEVMRSKRMYEAAALERKSDREEMHGQLKELEEKFENEMASLKHSVAEVLKYLQSRNEGTVSG